MEEKLQKICQLFWYHSITYNQHISQWKKNLISAQGFRSKAWQYIWCFLIQFSCISNRRTSKPKPFFETWGKTGQDRHASEWKFCVWRFSPVWPDIDLTLTSSWVGRKNECFHRILCPKLPIKHVSQHTTFTQYFRMIQWMGYTQAIKTIKISACVVRLSVPRCRNFVVYPTDKDQPSVLHKVSRRTLAYNFLCISFCMNEIENVKQFVVSSHFSLQN